MARGRGRPPSSARTRTNTAPTNSTSPIRSTRLRRSSTSVTDNAAAAPVAVVVIKDEEEDEMDTSQLDNDVQEDVMNNNKEADEEEPAAGPIEVKRRGRKRKAEVATEDRFSPATDPAKRGIIAQGGSLRRRETLKSTSRYSPPPASTRNSKNLSRSFPSTNQSKYVIDADADDFDANSGPTKASTDATATVSRRKSLGVRHTTNTVTTVDIEVAKAGDDKVIVTLPDGTTSKIIVPPKDTDQAAAADVAETRKETPSDPEYKPAMRITRKRSDTSHSATSNTATITTTTTAASGTGTITTISSNNNTSGTIDLKNVKTSNITTVKFSNQTTTTPIVSVTKVATSGGATPITTAAMTTATNTGAGTIKSSITAAVQKPLPTILKSTPTSTGTVAAIASTTAATITTSTTTTASVTPTVAKASTASSRRLQPLTKYLDALPELSDCMNADGIDDSAMAKLPDRVMLIHSELPLNLATSIDNEEKDYLFRQIISPVQSTRYVCLLCKGIDVNFGTKEEKDILLHYQSLHELDVDVGHAKFSEDVVFICLPKMVLSQLNSAHALHLNSACQYCETRLNDIEEMRTHYKASHSKEVTLMEQENIMNMHHSFYCSKCRHPSENFEAHHQHMKQVHHLKTYRCKACVLVTQDENRLRTHYKAKHMLHTSGQNYQCYYCHGLLIGVERLLKHIQQSHMVQTGTDFSCIACQQICGRGKELLNHAQNCALAGVKPESHGNKCVPIVIDPSPLADGEVECYFCNVRLESEEIYKLHLHHEHMKWLSDPVKASDEDMKMLTVDEMISDEDLRKAKIETYVGHWCRMCDQMVKVYQLYYLHMYNYHKLEKEFQCIITACKAQFKSFEDFKKHIEETGHSQKTVLSHPDEVFVCTYCDIYFPSEDELINHLITDQHINKFTASGHFHRTEPRNFKCKACHTFFGMKESYIHHLETEEHKYVCHYCGINTATSSSRRAHVQNTHPDKLHVCEECGEPQQDILAHFVSHGFTFECKKCIKKFYNRERLNAHMEVHQDPIECTWDMCGRMIATRSMLVTHYRGHKSEHKCQVCGQAFWNYSMLTSHLRSHQSLPRSGQTPRGNQSKAGGASYSNRSSGILSRARNSPQTNQVIKCGHCQSLFRSTRELNLHPCKGKISSNNVDANHKLHELAAKATNAQKAMGSHNNKPMSQVRRRPSPKKTGTMMVDQQMLEMAQIPGQVEQQVEEDTQLIMILNQVTGELMEITAPKGMEVKDVIESLNFQQMEEGTAAAAGVIATGEEHQIETEETLIEHQEISAPDAAQSSSTGETVADTAAATIEVIEHQTNDDQVDPTTAAIQIVTEAPSAIVQEQNNDAAAAAAVAVADGAGGDEAGKCTIETVDPSSMILEGEEAKQETSGGGGGGGDAHTTEDAPVIVVEGEEHAEAEDAAHQIQIIGEQGDHEQAIVLPANCFNEDGSLTLDAATLQRLNLVVDDSGQLTTDGSTTFIIGTSNAEE